MFVHTFKLSDEYLDNVRSILLKIINKLKNVVKISRRD